MKFDRVQSSFEPVPNSPGTQGHGEGIEYKGDYYYYKVGKHVPKDRAVSLVNEGNFCGRTTGEKNWIIVIWDKTDFVVLETIYFEGVRKALQKYKGKGLIECKNEREQEHQKYSLFTESIPTCPECNENKIIILDDDQPNNLCLTCHRKDK